MPTLDGCRALFWNYCSITKHFRRSRLRLDKINYLVVDRQFDRLNKVYQYKLIAV